MGVFRFKSSLKFLKLIWFVLDQDSKKKISIILLLILLSSFLEFAGLASIVPALVALKDPNVIYSNPLLNGFFKSLHFSSLSYFVLFLFILVFTLFLIKTLISIVIVKFNTEKIFSISTQLSGKVLKIIFSKSLLFLKNTNSSNLYRQINSYPTLFGSQIVLPLLNLISESVIVILILISILVYSSQVFLIVLALNLPIIYLFNAIYRKRVRSLGANVNRESITLVRTFQNIVHGFVDIKVREKEEFFTDSLTGTTKRVNFLTSQTTVLSLLPSRVLELSAIFVLIVIYSSSFFLSSSDQSIFTTISLFAVAAYKIMPSLGKVMQSTLSIRNNSFALVFLYKILKSETREGKHEESIPFKSIISLTNVRLKYSNNSNYVLNDLNLTIKRGEMLGIIGNSGAGKSSLINILLGLVGATEGSLRVDNKEVTLANAHAWRKHIGYVKQDTFLFDATILENVAIGYPISEIDVHQVETCLEKAHLKPFVAELKDGIYTHVGEMGGRVSGGQKQRMGIARALYSDPEILILDEATSALDVNTEAEIINEIGELKDRSKSIIIVAHRYTSLKNCDRIIRLNQGKIEKEYTNYKQLEEEIKL